MYVNEVLLSENNKNSTSNKLFVIKIGGNVIDNPENLKKFLHDFAAIDGHKILIHGGGKIATEISESMGLVPNLIDGRRITDFETLKVVTMVYAGFINKNIVAQLQSYNCNAIGLTGADGNFIKAKKRPVKTIDYGFVGDLDAVALSKLYETTLIYCFEKKGVLRDINNEASLINEINPAEFEKLKQENIIHSGMLPKLENAFAAIACGVKEVIIGKSDDLETFKHYKPFGTRLIENL